MRTGSLINMIADGSAATDFAVGDGATIIRWSDRQACTVIERSRTGHQIRLQYDTATRTDGLGMTDAQSYEYAANPDGVIVTATRRRDGAYRLTGSTERVVPGRSHYHDYTF